MCNTVSLLAKPCCSCRTDSGTAGQVQDTAQVLAPIGVMTCVCRQTG